MFLGSLIDLIAVLEKAISPISVNESGSSILVRFEQLLNTYFPRDVTVFGTVTEVSFVPLKAPSGIVWRVFGIVIELMPVLEKACSPSSVSFDGRGA